jgi:hypothetical protein
MGGIVDCGPAGVNYKTIFRAALHSPFPMDVLVRSPEKIQKRLQLGDPFLKTIVEKGEVLYEAVVA